MIAWVNAEDVAARLEGRLNVRCIILASAQGMNNGQVAAALRVSAPTVGKWRARYIAQGIESLETLPAAARPDESPTARWKR